METIKKEKRRSFLGGIFAGMCVTAIVLTVVFCILITRQANNFSSKITSSNSASTGGNTNTVVGSGNTDTLLDPQTEAKIDVLYDYIQKYFYFEDDIDTDKMRDDMYAAIMESMGDPYTVYYTAQELTDLFEESEGVYYGVGSYVQMDETYNLPMFSGVFEQSPAQKAGIRDGDLIYAVDGVEISGMTLTEVTNIIKGPIDTPVVITIIREGESDKLDITVIRGKIETPTVIYEMKEDKIGYLQITQFDDITSSQFKDAYDDLNNQGMEGLIIDLRSNPGGNLDTVVDICEYILPAGTITYTIDRQGNRTDYNGNGTHPIEIPLVVLVNEYSASASELMTGAIRDYQKGTIVGKNTFGKGIVQQIYSLGDGTGIKITTSSYFTPNGECIHKTGIAPDIEVELDGELYYSDEKIDTQLDAALECIHDKLGH